MSNELETALIAAVAALVGAIVGGLIPAWAARKQKAVDLYGEWATFVQGTIRLNQRYLRALQAYQDAMKALRLLRQQRLAELQLGTGGPTSEHALQNAEAAMLDVSQMLKATQEETEKADHDMKASVAVIQMIESRPKLVRLVLRVTAMATLDYPDGTEPSGPRYELRFKRVIRSALPLTLNAVVQRYKARGWWNWLKRLGSKRRFPKRPLVKPLLVPAKGHKR